VALLVVTRLLTRRTQKQNLYLNILAPEGEGTAPAFASVNEILAQHARFVDMRRLDRRDHTLQLTYLIDCQDQDELAGLMDALKEGIPGCSFSFVDQSTMPG
jgi:hypothetical protein